MKRKLDYTFLDCAKKMPPLSHSMQGQKFDITKSEVAQWLKEQPQIMQKIFNMAGNQKIITYNADTGKWQGVDYDGN